jgi:hypothetical protein
VHTQIWGILSVLVLILKEEKKKSQPRYFREIFVGAVSSSLMRYGGDIQNEYICMKLYFNQFKNKAT